MTREIKDGKLYFDGCDTTELAREYGTPLYVMSENAFLSLEKNSRINTLKQEWLTPAKLFAIWPC